MLADVSLLTDIEKDYIIRQINKTLQYSNYDCVQPKLSCLLNVIF